MSVSILSRRAALAAFIAAAGCAARPDLIAEDRMAVAGRHGAIDVRTFGAPRGLTVVMIPSLGRGAGDFEMLARAVAASGFHAACPEPRGFAASAPYGAQTDLGDLAEDIADVIAATAAGRPAVVLGHAFGNRVARMCAALRPDLVRAVVLLAAGGKVAMAPEIEQALLASFDLDLPDAVRMKAVATAFFAPGNDATVWRDGWRRDIAEAQIAASERTPVDAWWQAGAAPVLVVQPKQDVLAPAENAEKLRAAAPDRVRVVYVENAGHALLPEQPAAVAGAVISFLRSLEG